ncbi:MAG: ABC transporter permease [Longimicrobiales bacterium]
MFNDIRYAIRSLGKAPGAALMVILCLGLGVGANTTIFSFTNALFLRPLPVHEPERLVRVHSGWGTEQFRSSSYPEFQAAHALSSVFAGVAAYRSARISIGQGDDVSLAQAMLVTAQYFDLVGVRPLHGRFMSASDDRANDAEPVVVITHAYWQARMASDPAAIGRTIQVSGRPYTIIGVAPAAFAGTEPDEAIAVWLPLMSFRHVLGADDRFLTQNAHGFGVIARLQPGVPIERAQAAASNAARNLAVAHGAEWESLRFTVLPAGTLVQRRANGEISTVFVLLNSVVGLVLLIACANVANILLARGLARQREIAIRLSLGAGRVRLIRQLLVESVLLGLGGGVLGLLLALWGSDLLRAFDLPAAINPAPDHRVLLYTLAVALLTGIVFGVMPALQATRVTLTDTLKQSSRTVAPARSWLRSTLVTSQISLSVLLLVLSGLFLRALLELRTANSGINESNLLAAALDLRTLNLNVEQGRALADRIQERIAGLPGVQSATLSTTVPSGGRHWSSSVTLPEHDAFRTRDVGLSYNLIGTDYLATLDVPVLRGRPLSHSDRAGAAPVLLVNRAFVRQYFPTTEPLGKHVVLDSITWEIVGIVADVRYESAAYDAEPILLMSIHQYYDPSLTLQVRTQGPPGRLIAPIRSALNGLHPGLAAEYRTFQQIRYEAQFAPRMVSTLLSIFGALALLLASLGLYGVTAYIVTLRTHEIGVRMALGALPRGVLQLIAREGVRLVALGASIGLILAFAAGRLFASQLYGVSPFDSLIVTAVVVLMGSVTLVACLIPGRRAARVDPMVALRVD